MDSVFRHCATIFLVQFLALDFMHILFKGNTLGEVMWQAQGHPACEDPGFKPGLNSKPLEKTVCHHFLISMEANFRGC